jgi:hypothetical protein
MSSIKTIKFSRYGEPLSYPIYTLNSSDKLMLDFDDVDGGVKNYFFSICIFTLKNKKIEMLLP